jgi:hypothetical protein
VTERADLPSQLACLPSGRSRSMANRDRGLPRVSRFSAEPIARVHAPENCNRMLLHAKVQEKWVHVIYPEEIWLVRSYWVLPLALITFDGTLHSTCGRRLSVLMWCRKTLSPSASLKSWSSVPLFSNSVRPSKRMLATSSYILSPISTISIKQST